MSIHSGHRQRLKDRFAREGLDNFEQHQVLELLLFYAIPRADTNPIAHALLERFGSLDQVLEATAPELRKVPGMGDHAAQFLSLVSQVGRYYQVCRVSRPTILATLDQCGQYLLPRFCGRRNETVFLLCLDAKRKALICKEVGEGSVNSAAVPIRRVVEMALAAGATYAVLAHNHPCGIALPSQEDVYVTRRVAMALAAVEIELLDHIVVADDDFVSLSQSGWYHYEDCKPWV